MAKRNRSRRPHGSRAKRWRAIAESLAFKLNEEQSGLLRERHEESVGSYTPDPVLDSISESTMRELYPAPPAYPPAVVKRDAIDDLVELPDVLRKK